MIFRQALQILDRLPQLVRDKREMLNLTRRETAKQMEISADTFKRIELGEGVMTASAMRALEWLANK